MINSKLNFLSVFILLFSYGCESTFNDYDEIESIPESANFEIKNNTVCLVPCQLELIDKSVGLFDSYEWRVNDTFYSAESQPVLEIDAIGNYNIELIVTNSLGTVNHVKQIGAYRSGAVSGSVQEGANAMIQDGPNFVACGQRADAFVFNAGIFEINDNEITASQFFEGSPSSFKDILKFEDHYFAVGSSSFPAVIYKINPDGFVTVNSWNLFNEGVGEDIKVTNGDTLLVGTTSSFDLPNIDMGIVALNEDLDTIFRKSWTMDRSSNVRVSAREDSYILIGSCNNCPENEAENNIIVKSIEMDGSSDALNDFYLSFPGYEYAAEILSTPNNSDFVIGGYWSDILGGQKDMIFCNFNIDTQSSSFNKIGNSDYDEQANAMVEAGDGYLMIGTFKRYGIQEADTDIIITKVDNMGAEEWSRIYSSIFDEEANSIIAIDEGYAIAGSTANTGSDDDSDILFFKIDEDGDIID